MDSILGFLSRAEKTQEKSRREGTDGFPKGLWLMVLLDPKSKELFYGHSKVKTLDIIRFLFSKKNRNYLEKKDGPC